LAIAPTPIENQPATVAAAQAQAQKPVKPKQPVKKEVEKAVSLSTALKRIVVKQPKIPVDELVKQLEAMGYTGRSVVTIKTLYSDCQTTLRVAAAAGLFPPF
jgi:hypothetical protein